MSQVAPTTVQANIRTIAELIKDVRVAMMLTTRLTPSNLFALHARPMYTQKINPDNFTGELWFFTDNTTEKVAEIRANPQIMLTYALPDKNTYVVVYGIATCEQNEAQARELWNIHAKGWWPDGPESQSLRLIRVQLDNAEYWQGPSNTSYMLSLLKAVATGDKINITSEHGVVN